MSYERERGTARQRGYDGQWSKAAAGFKQKHPWCLGCQAIGKRVKVEVVDHVVPHKGDRAKFWNSALWQPACGFHHDVVKKRLERMFEVGEVGIADLWLNSAAAIALTHRLERKTFGADGWPVA